MGLVAGFAYGVCGGVLAELLGLFQLRKLAPSRRPHFLRSCFYWSITCAMVAAGGVLVVIYLASDIALKPLVAVNIGASAPLVIGKLVAQTEPIEPGKIG